MPPAQVESFSSLFSRGCRARERIYCIFQISNIHACEENVCQVKSDSRILDPGRNCSSLLRKEGQDEWGNGSIAVTWNRKRQRDLHLFNSLQFPQSRSIAFMILLWWKNFSEARLCQERRIRNAKRFSMEISFSRYAPKIFIYGERSFTYFHIYECSPATCSSVKPYSDCAWDEKKKEKR